MWPPEALDFLRELEANNDREWFRDHRARYEAVLRGPAVALAAKLRHLGEARTFRPYNDTRFHPKPPIKEHLGVAIGYGSAGGYYFELSLDGLLVAAGLYRPAPDQLERYRAAIDDDRRAELFEAAIAGAVASGLGPAEPTLRRGPRGYPAACDTRLRRELESARSLVNWLAEYVGPSDRPAP